MCVCFSLFVSLFLRHSTVCLLSSVCSLYFDCLRPYGCLYEVCILLVCCLSVCLLFSMNVQFFLACRSVSDILVCLLIYCQLCINHYMAWCLLIY